MTKRKMCAAAVLAASLALPAASQTMAAASGDLQWAYVLGMRGREAAAFGVASVLMCGAIANPGSIACGLAGVG
jgi:hypothetical protein